MTSTRDRSLCHVIVEIMTLQNDRTYDFSSIGELEKPV